MACSKCGKKNTIPKKEAPKLVWGTSTTKGKVAKRSKVRKL